MRNPCFADTPEPPYYVVIFSAQRTPGDNGYADMAERMVELAARQPGFLGIERARNPDGFGLNVSYWASEEAIAAWRNHAEHALARQTGRERGCAQFSLRVARVERAYGTTLRK